MIKLACGVWGCWPIVFTSTTTTTVPTTPLISTTEEVRSYTINEQSDLSSNWVYPIAIGSILAIVIAVLVIRKWIKTNEKKKRKAEIQLIQIVIAAAQKSVIENMNNE